MKKKIILMLFFAVTAAIVLNDRFDIFTKPVKETIIFFPIDASVSFKSADTTLTLERNNGPIVSWKTNSILDRKAYLRQDLGLLFANGGLKGKMAEWKQNTSEINQKDKIKGMGSSRIDAITFHYAELHGGNSTIKSAQTMSDDFLYIIDSSFTPLSSFRVAKSREEKEWKKVLDRNIENKLINSLKKASQKEGLNLENYIFFPLNEIRNYEDQPLPGFTEEKSANIIGNLWEGLYKNYALGIKKSDGTVIDPIGSTMPLILISKDKSHLLVITETKDGESIVLKQMI